MYPMANEINTTTRYKAALPKSRDARIALAAQVARRRVYTVDLDRPTLIGFEISVSDNARDTLVEVRRIAEDLLRLGFGAVCYSDPMRGTGTWFVSNLTVDLKV